MKTLPPLDAVTQFVNAMNQGDLETALKSVTVQYFEAPPEVFEGPEAIRSWVQKALGVALRAKGSKTPNKVLNWTRQKRRAG